MIASQYDIQEAPVAIHPVTITSEEVHVKQNSSKGWSVQPAMVRAIYSMQLKLRIEVYIA